ncbi:hypothetical protein R69608_06917 [Paraburkholderia nemoris]|uniref:DUF3775 domain-containing protein n=1 Tax=Paraburkholderia nemoris TaxID=2793076 RepID=UPI001914D897|nr:DUF3775 domain-containing protein [Paraburkholderia nemoris]MBK5152400.1 DUF3775 domain-containing protein [Burkholderia sp. R-69608]CAE6966617.1 hypothetical protein R69608_06917 [Paraburkholderia nemoris]
MTLTVQLSDTIDALIAADLSSQAHSSMRQILENVTDDELAHVMALALFGRADGDAGEGATFEQSLDDAREHVNESGRDRTITYVGGKPLSRYLPAGLKRAGLR